METKPLSDYRNWLFKKAGIIREKDDDYAQKENVFWAGDLLMCRRKRKFRLDKTEVPFKVDPSTYGRILGTLVHKGLEEFLKEDGWTAEIKKRKTFGDYIVSAKADGVKGDEIIEIKYQRYFKGALPNHLLQLGIYLNVFEKKRGVLFYVSPNDIADFYTASKVTDDNIMWLIKNGLSPFADFECKYCDYRKFCSEVGKR